MDSPYATIEVIRAPVVHVRVVGEPDDNNYPDYLEALAREFRRLDRFAMLFNTGSLTQFPAKYREMQDRWLADTQSEFEGRWVCSAFVIPSRVIRGVLMALFWLRKPYYGYAVLPTESAAWEWIEQQLSEAAISVSTPQESE